MPWFDFDDSGMNKYTNFYDLLIRLKSCCEILEALGITVWISFLQGMAFERKNIYSQNWRCGEKTFNTKG